jgi:uncharacterized membrane protein (DUF441 family)
MIVPKLLKISMLSSQATLFKINIQGSVHFYAMLKGINSHDLILSGRGYLFAKNQLMHQRISKRTLARVAYFLGIQIGELFKG